MGKCIYLDHAATSWPKPDAVIKAMVDFNANVGANPGRSGHRRSIEAGRIIFDARERIATLLGADDPQSVIFTRNATEGLNTVLHGMLQPGDHVVTSSMEHNSVMRPLQALAKQGVERTVVRCSATGEVALDDLTAAIQKKTRMIVWTHASNVTGTIMPVTDIAKVAHGHGLVFCVDAAQTAGCVPIHVLQDDIDILVFTGHKSLNGPQGTGGFYIRTGMEGQIRPLEYGGTGSRSEFEEHPEFMPDRFESGTPNTIGIAGLGAGAAHVAALGVAAVRRQEIALTGLLMDGLGAIPGVKICGDRDPSRRTALVSFTLDGISPSDLALQLDERFDILSRPGLHCAPSAHRTIGTFPEGTVRFSFGLSTEKGEILTAVKAVERLAHENAG
jgi:cysteine desulfurase family protein